MPASDVKISAPEANALAAQLHQLAGRVGRPRPLLERMRTVIAQGEAKAFESSGTSIGESWPPAVEPDRKLTSRLLVATGRLRSSLTTHGGDAEQTIRGTALYYGTNVPYAGYLQHGTGRMAARPFLGVSRDTARALMVLVDEYTTREAGQ